MLIKAELELFLDTHMNNFDESNKKRILYCYGFIDGFTHTGTEAYSVYKNEQNKNVDAKNPRAGIASIIKQFKKKLAENPLKTLLLCENILNTQPILLNSRKYFDELRNAGLVIEGFASTRGVLLLAQEIGLCLNFGLYACDLTNLLSAKTKTLFKYKKQDSFLIKRSIISDLEIGLGIAEGLPGDVGLAKREYLIKELKGRSNYVDQILELLKSNPSNIVFQDGLETYYYIRKGKNVLVNRLGKVFSVVSKVDVEEFSEAIYRSFSQRGKIDAVKYPSPSVICKFLENFDSVDVKDRYLVYSGRKIKLASIEKDVVEYLKEKTSIKWKELEAYLKVSRFDASGKEKYGEARLKDVFSLPILNRSGPRGNFTFSLIGNEIQDSALEDAVQGGINGIKTIRRRHIVSREEFDEAQDKAKDIGLRGEKIINEFLGSQELNGLIKKSQWVSEDDPTAPFDFLVIEVDNSTTHIDVKTTSGKFSNIIHVSFSELLEMESVNNYRIYRVYDIDNQIRLRVSESMKDFSKKVNFIFSSLPSGVTIDGISLSPNSNLVKFDSEMIL